MKNKHIDTCFGKLKMLIVCWFIALTSLMWSKIRSDTLKLQSSSNLCCNILWNSMCFSIIAIRNKNRTWTWYENRNCLNQFSPVSSHTTPQHYFYFAFWFGPTFRSIPLWGIGTSARGRGDNSLISFSLSKVLQIREEVTKIKLYFTKTKLKSI